MTKRKTELSVMNLVMCMLVIFIHIASWSINVMDKSSLQYLCLLVPWRLSAFVVQGFLFLSGVKLFASEKPFHYGKFLLGRVQKIVVPYLLWVGIYYACFISIGWYVFSLCDLVEYICLGTLCSHFYYVIVAIQFYLLLPVWKWLLRRLPLWLTVGASLVITVLYKRYLHFPYDDRVFIGYLCYFVAGAAVGMHYARVCAILKKWWWISAAAFVGFGFFDALLTYRSQVRGAVYPWFEVLHIGYCFAAIACLFAVSLLLFEGRKLWGLVSLIDRSSYGIYLSHILWIYVANNELHRLGVSDLLYAFVLRGAFTYVATLALCALYTFGKERLFHARKNP